MSIKIGLAGNPNSGKTTMFNNLTGAKQYVGNWPGVTVEKKGGKIRGYKDVELVDTEAPTVPTNIKAENITENSADISWEASTDNVGVVSYEVYNLSLIHI